MSSRDFRSDQGRKGSTTLGRQWVSYDKSLSIMTLHLLLQHALSIVSFVLTVTFISFVLRSKKPPGSTLAWLGFIILIPYVGIPGYLLLSGRKLGGKFSKKRKLYSQHSSANPAVVQTLEDYTASILANSGSPPARGGCSIVLLDQGDVAYAKILELIASAKETIHLTTFIFSNDEVGKTIVEKLEEKAKQGIRIRVLLDSFGASWAGHPSFRKLTKVGVEVAYFMPFFHLPFRGRSNLRNHRKLLIVDSKRAIAGGMNLGIEYMGPAPDSHRWVDLGMLVEGEVVDDLEAIFSNDWSFASHTSDTSKKINGATTPGHERVQAVASGPDAIGDPFYEALLSLIFSARQRVRIATPYFIPDESLAKALELAAKRGVDVEILVPRRSNHKLADLARGTYLSQLATAGAKIRLLPQMTHSKLVLIDDACVLAGSANFDMRSLLFNFELGILAWSPGMISTCEKWFSGWFEKAQPYEPKPGFFRDMLYGAARVVGPLI